MVQDGQPIHFLLVNLILSSERVVDGLELEPDFLQSIRLNQVLLVDRGLCVTEENTLDELSRGKAQRTWQSCPVSREVCVGYTYLGDFLS